MGLQYAILAAYWLLQWKMKIVHFAQLSEEWNYFSCSCVCEMARKVSMDFSLSISTWWSCVIGVLVIGWGWIMVSFGFPCGDQLLPPPKSIEEVDGNCSGTSFHWELWSCTDDRVWSKCRGSRWIAFLAECRCILGQKDPMLKSSDFMVRREWRC